MSIRGRIVLMNRFLTVSGGEQVTGVNLKIIDDTKEMCMSAFADAAIKAYDLIEVGKCYQVTGFTVMKSKFSTSGQEIRLTSSSKLTEIGDDGKFPKIDLEIKRLDEILIMDHGSVVDTIGIVVYNSGLKTATSRSTYRYLFITDYTKQRVRVTLFKQMAVDFGDCLKIPIAIREAIVGTHKEEKCLVARNTSLVWKTSSLEETKKLAEWFEEDDKLSLRE